MPRLRGTTSSRGCSGTGTASREKPQGSKVCFVNDLRIHYDTDAALDVAARLSRSFNLVRLVGLGSAAAFVVFVVVFLRSQPELSMIMGAITVVDLVLFGWWMPRQAQQRLHAITKVTTRDGWLMTLTHHGVRRPVPGGGEELIPWPRVHIMEARHASHVHTPHGIALTIDGDLLTLTDETVSPSVHEIVESYRRFVQPA